MGRVAIFIDGGYLDKVLETEFDRARIDYRKLSEKIVGNQDHLRTYYYHCLPYQSNPPTTDESDRFSRAQAFFYNLDRLPRFEVKQGRLAFRGFDSDGRPIFEQKKVDVMFSVDLVLLSVKTQITEAAIIAGDSDLLPAVEVAKREGVLIKLYHGNIQRPHTDLYNTADERIVINQDIINNVLR